MKNQNLIMTFLFILTVGLVAVILLQPLPTQAAFIRMNPTIAQMGNTDSIRPVRGIVTGATTTEQSQITLIESEIAQLQELRVRLMKIN